MRQRESTASSECSRALADAFASSRRCRSSARNSARSARLSSEVGASHTLRSPDAGSHRPPAFGPVYLPNVGGPSVSSPECTFVFPPPSFPPAPRRYGSPCRRPLLRHPLDGLAVSDPALLSRSTRLRFHPPGSEFP